ncbi:class I SAM-dependent DNA methyltransferase [Polynucleobacter brandtiae]|uniref:Methyltransferase family protein n=1 Tax=Polynucleobacter brandtiae TaxID=1938816 RepID=A0A2M8VJI9_9BURK|nr:class I SAM-dependent methyltransferase [Polynucleobacter brandtiae]PJI77159.1 methyltransferase family protein [Polynucleobacter brandtiae]
MSRIFDAYAAYYDLLYQDKDYEAEANFVRGLLSKYSAEMGNKLLELGCGTGRHAEIFSRMGYAVHGIDLSEAMVNAAGSRKYSDCLVEPIYTVGDVRSIRLEKLFNVVISLFHVASYQTSNLDLKNMFLTVAEHLHPGGIFIFDCWYGPGVLTDLPKNRVKKMISEEFEVTRIANPTIYPNSNLVDVGFNVEVVEKATRKVSHIAEIHKMRYLFKPEIDYLLGEVGLRCIEVLEWMTDRQAGLETWTAVFVIKKEDF